MKKLLLITLLLTTNAFAGSWCSGTVMDDKNLRDKLRGEGTLNAPTCVCKGSPADLMRALKQTQNVTAGQTGKYRVENETNSSLEIVYSMSFSEYGTISIRGYYTKSLSTCKKKIAKYVKELKKNPYKKYE